jgi:asparagine N-glycosylation enzyme membrane subunit Stt3
MKKGRFQKFLEQKDIIAAVLITILTILIAIDKSPFQYSLSMIGNWFSAADRVKFLIWGFIVSLLLVWLILQVYKRAKFKNKKARNLLFLAGIFLILTVIIPTASREPIPKELRMVTWIS